ncbi:MAG: hypothetical protein ABI729_02700 [Chitinophagales bacterium]
MKNKTANPGRSKNDLPESKAQNEKPEEGGNLPGYPLYPASEDIMNPANAMEKIDLNEENISPDTTAFNAESNKKATTANEQPAALNDDEEETEESETKSETDLTEADFLALGNDELNTVEEDDLLLQKRPNPVDMAGSDLDVPGSELDDDDEIIGSEDEENNTYSIGGDRHDDLEDNSQDNDEQL